MRIVLSVPENTNERYFPGDSHNESFIGHDRSFFNFLPIENIFKQDDQNIDLLCFYKIQVNEVEAFWNESEREEYKQNAARPHGYTDDEENSAESLIIQAARRKLESKYNIEARDLQNKILILMFSDMYGFYYAAHTVLLELQKGNNEDSPSCEPEIAIPQTEPTKLNLEFINNKDKVILEMPVAFYSVNEMPIRYTLEEQITENYKISHAPLGKIFLIVDIKNDNVKFEQWGLSLEPSKENLPRFMAFFQANYQRLKMLQIEWELNKDEEKILAMAKYLNDASSQILTNNSEIWVQNSRLENEVNEFIDWLDKSIVSKILDTINNMSQGKKNALIGLLNECISVVANSHVHSHIKYSTTTEREAYKHAVKKRALENFYEQTEKLLNKRLGKKIFESLIKHQEITVVSFNSEIVVIVDIKNGTLKFKDKDDYLSFDKNLPQLMAFWQKNHHTIKKSLNDIYEFQYVKEQEKDKLEILEMAEYLDEESFGHLNDANNADFYTNLGITNDVRHFVEWTNNNVITAICKTINTLQNETQKNNLLSLLDEHIGKVANAYIRALNITNPTLFRRKIHRHQVNRDSLNLFYSKAEKALSSDPAAVNILLNNRKKVKWEIVWRLAKESSDYIFNKDTINEEKSFIAKISSLPVRILNQFSRESIQKNIEWFKSKLTKKNLRLIFSPPYIIEKTIKGIIWLIDTITKPIHWTLQYLVELPLLFLSKVAKWYFDYYLAQAQENKFYHLSAFAFCTAYLLLDGLFLLARATISPGKSYEEARKKGVVYGILSIFTTLAVWTIIAGPLSIPMGMVAGWPIAHEVAAVIGAGLKTVEGFAVIPQFFSQAHLVARAVCASAFGLAVAAKNWITSKLKKDVSPPTPQRFDDILNESQLADANQRSQTNTALKHAGSFSEIPALLGAGPLGAGSRNGVGRQSSSPGRNDLSGISRAESSVFGSFSFNGVLGLFDNPAFSSSSRPGSTSFINLDLLANQLTVVEEETPGSHNSGSSDERRRRHSSP